MDSCSGLALADCWLHPLRLFHPNVNGEGGICLDILNDPTLWSPAIGLEKLLVSVASLLSEPRVEHGLNDEAVALLRSDPSAFEERARARAAPTTCPAAVRPRTPLAGAPGPGGPSPLRRTEAATTAPGADSERPAPLKDGSGVCGLLLGGLVLGLAYVIRSQSL
ncbi:UBC29 [Symbiodinium sp. CCMP2592]|nr:UBC29 [Symbiodinium sp. CCMP2592]